MADRELSLLSFNSPVLPCRSIDVTNSSPIILEDPCQIRASCLAMVVYGTLPRIQARGPLRKTTEKRHLWVRVSFCFKSQLFDVYKNLCGYRTGVRQ